MNALLWIIRLPLQILALTCPHAMPLAYSVMLLLSDWTHSTSSVTAAPQLLGGLSEGASQPPSLLS